MKNCLLILFLLNICCVLPAFSSRINSDTRDEGIYIPQNAVTAMQQKEDLAKSVAQKARYYSQEHGRVADNNTQNSTQKENTPALLPQKKFPQAPIDAILKKQRYPLYMTEEYKKSITRTYAVMPNDLKTILQNELNTITAENERMQQIRQHWDNQSPVYQFINYQLNTQIANEISSSRKHFQRREQVFIDFFSKAKTDKPVYIIEATNPLFWLLSTNPQISQYSFQKNIYYISIFDHSYNHLFTYHRMHVNANRNRRILATDSGNANINNKFQKLFDDYGNDLKRIGLGLDVTNRTLSEQVKTMQNGYITETY